MSAVSQVALQQDRVARPGWEMEMFMCRRQNLAARLTLQAALAKANPVAACTVPDHATRHQLSFGSRLHRLFYGPFRKRRKVRVETIQRCI